MRKDGGSDGEFGEEDEEEDGDALARVPPTDVDPETLEKLRRQVIYF